MEKAIKSEFGMSRLLKIILVIGLTAFVGLSVFIYIKLYSDIRETVVRQANDSITNISELNVSAISSAITNREKLLKMLSGNLSHKFESGEIDVDDLDRILSEIETFGLTFDFYSFGVMTEPETALFCNGNQYDVSDNPPFQQAWAEEFRLSESYMPVVGGNYAVNLFSCPVYYEHEMKYVIVATYYSKNLTKRMNLSSMNGKGYNFLVNSQGEVVIYPKHYDDEVYNGLMKYVNDTADIIPDLTQESTFTYKDEVYDTHYEMLGINDWYLMTCARQTDVLADANVISRSVFFGMGVLWVMILIAIFSIVYSVYRSRKELRRAVFYDELLDIGNGNCLPVFFRQLPKAELLDMALMVFDIDKFKEFNYIYGEECGDQLLHYIVETFHEELPEEYLFRYLSDYFVALVHSVTKEDFIVKMEKLLQRFKKDIDEGKIQSFDISAGIRKIHEGEPFRRVMSDALLAKGTIKGIQVQQYAFYDTETFNRRMKYMEFESDFSRALRNKEFHVYYQPKYDMRTGAVIGAEALVRWIKADGRMIMPGEFIPCFEASRQIILLDEAMLEAVCQQMKEMEEEGIAVQKVSVNLSRVHLRHSGILEKIARIIKESGVDPGKLSFEITESALYEDSIPLKQIVDALHELGCKVDMDDYGIGVSGPNALAANQFDVVKMDRSFINGIGNRRMEAVIQSTIHLSERLGIEILAEGVEEKHQADRLVEWGCTLAQGFYYSPPVPMEEYRRLLIEHAPAAAEKEN